MRRAVPTEESIHEPLRGDLALGIDIADGDGGHHSDDPRRCAASIAGFRFT